MSGVLWFFGSSFLAKTLFFFHHSGTGWSSSHLSRTPCSTTLKVFFNSPGDCILWRTLWGYAHVVFSWLLSLTHLCLHPRECFWSIHQIQWDFSSSFKGLFCHPLTLILHSQPGCWSLLSLPVHSCFLTYQTVDFEQLTVTRPNFLIMSRIYLFIFFSLMMAHFTDIDTSLVLMLGDNNRLQMQMVLLESILELLLPVLCMN